MLDGGATTIGVIVHMCMHELQLQVAHGCDCMLVRLCVIDCGWYMGVPVRVPVGVVVGVVMCDT